MKDARIKRLHTGGLHLYDRLEKATLYGQKTDLWLPGAGSREGLATKGMIVVRLIQLHAFVSTQRTGHQKSEFFCM